MVCPFGPGAESLGFASWLWRFSAVWPQVRLLASVGLDCPTCNTGITQPVRRRAAVQTGGPTRVIHVRGPGSRERGRLTVASTRAHTLRRSRCISRCFPPPHSAPEIHTEEAVAATAKNPAEQKRRSKARSGPQSSGNQQAAGQSVKKITGYGDSVRTEFQANGQYCISCGYKYTRGKRLSNACQAQVSRRLCRQGEGKGLLERAAGFKCHGDVHSFNNRAPGVPGWLSRLGVRLRLRS